MPVLHRNMRRAPAAAQGLDIIRLATPTSNDARLPRILDGASGFVYYVSIAGVTGTKNFDPGDVKAAVARIRGASTLPVAVGFGVKTPDHAREIARIADAVVVGSAIVSLIGANAGAPKDKIVSAVLDLCRALADSTHAARAETV